MGRKLTRRISVNMDDESWDMLSRMAAEKHVSKGAMARRIIGEALHPPLYVKEDAGKNYSGKDHKVTVRIPGDAYDEIRGEAEKRGYTVSGFLRHLATYGSIFLEVTVSTFDVTCLLERATRNYYLVKNTIRFLRGNGEMNEAAYQAITELLEDTLTATEELHKTAIKEITTERRQAVREITEKAMRQYDRQERRLMLKNWRA